MAPKCDYLQWPSRFLGARRPAQINEALLQLSQVDTTNGSPVTWYGVTAECSLRCQLVELPSDCALVSSTHDYHLEARDAAGAVKSTRTVHVGERGVYSAESEGTKLSFTALVEPSPNWGPLAALVLALVGVVLVWGGYSTWRSRREPAGEVGATPPPASQDEGGDAALNEDLLATAHYLPVLSANHLAEEGLTEKPGAEEPDAGTTPKPKSGRLESLDSFRG